MTDDDNSPLHDDDEEDDCPPNPFLNNNTDFGLEENEVENDNESDYDDYDSDDYTDDDDDDDDDSKARMGSKTIEPLEFTTYANPPPLPPMMDTMLAINYVLPILFSVIPLCLGTTLIYSMLPKLWTASFFLLHLAMQLLVSKYMYRCYIFLPIAKVAQHRYTLVIQDGSHSNSSSNNNTDNHLWRQTCSKCLHVSFTCVHIALDVFIFYQVYPSIINGIIDNLFTEPDDEVVLEYRDVTNDLRRIVAYCQFVVNARIFSLVVGGIVIGVSFVRNKWKREKVGENNVAEGEGEEAHVDSETSASTIMLHYK
eukprot:937559-Ditylum_brightwellii.AAC.1